MRSFQHLLVGGQGQTAGEQRFALCFAIIEVAEKLAGVGDFEIVGRHLDLVLQEDVAIGDRAALALGPDEVVNAVYLLQIHGDTLDTVGNLSADGVAFEPTHLLEIGKLGDLHAIEQTSQPRPQAPSVGDSQLSSTKRTSCTAMSMPR